MKSKEIIAGCRYCANISGKRVSVEVTGIRLIPTHAGFRTVYDVINLRNKRKLTFNSPNRFVSRLDWEPTNKSVQQMLPLEQETMPKVNGQPTKKKTSVLSKLHRTHPPHLMITALAGTGKTTTIVEGLKHLNSIEPDIVPSKQQQHIWDLLRLSKDADHVLFVAFNKSIAQELQARIKHVPNCSARTMHSLGISVVMNAFDLTPNHCVNGDKTKHLLAKLMGVPLFDLRRSYPEITEAVCKLVDVAKSSLVGKERSFDFTDNGDSYWFKQFGTLCSHHNIELAASITRIFDLALSCLQLSAEVGECRIIDYTDMIWLPVVLDLPLPKYDLLLVDEFQDTNLCQQELIIRCAKRIVGVGDPNQAIYGFAGASTSSIKDFTNKLSATKQGCDTASLTMTRRCGHIIVKEAKKIVPDLEAHPDNPPGVVERKMFDRGSTQYYGSEVRKGDLVLCRINSVLVQECIYFLKNNKKARVQGRDIGKGLLILIDRLCKGTDGTIVQLIQASNRLLDQEIKKENAKHNPSDFKLMFLQDRHDCLMSFCEDASSVSQIRSSIEKIFQDDGDGILLSSIHKAKGLEADTVWFLMPDHAKCPSPMATQDWAKEQELNLRYVGETRAISRLVRVY